MKRNVLFLSTCSLACLFLFSCVSDKRADKDTADDAEIVDISGNLKEDGTLPTISPDQKEVIDYQKEQKGKKRSEVPKDYAIKKGNFDGFLVGNWTFDIKVDVNDGVDEELKGQILQLHGDETFNIIQEGTVIQEGNFRYDRNTTTLRLIPTTGQASEWVVNAMNSAVILIGTPTFNNNMTQIRLFEGVVE